MGYFTGTLIKEVCDEQLDATALFALEEAWQRKGQLYYENLKKMEGRLPSNLYKLLTTNRLRNFSVSSMDFTHVVKGRREIRLVVENERECLEFLFGYVTDFDISRSCNEAIEPQYMNILVCEELISLGEEGMALEMVLGSGMKIVIRFVDGSVKLVKRKAGEKHAEQKM